MRSVALTSRVAAVCSLALATVSCSAPGDPSAPAGDHVTAIVMPYLSVMPFHIAQEEGFFADEGLEVEFRTVGRNQEVMATLAHGDVDVSSGMLTLNELSLAASGARLRLVTSLGESDPDACTFLGIVARREHLESGALEDRARIGQLRFDFDPLLPLGYILDELLRPYDLTTADVDHVNLTPPVAVAMLQRGDVDVTIDSEPFVSMHLATGEAVIWRGVQEFLPGYVSAATMFGPTLLDERPDVGRRFAVALLRAIRQFRQGKTPRNLDIVERATGLTREQVTEACWPVPPEDGRIDASTFLGYQQWSVAHGLLDRILQEDELVDDRFIEQANTELAR